MRRINRKIKALWGIADLSFSVMIYMEISFLVYFLTDVAKLPLSVTAAIAGLSAFTDVAGAIVAGIVIDKVNFKVGKYRPWLIYCPPVITVFFIFCFTKIGKNIAAGIIIGIGYVVSNFMWNIALTANRNLIPILTDDPNERSYLSAHIGVGASLGKIIASYLVPSLSAAFLTIFSEVEAYTVTAAVIGIMLMVCCFITYAITKGYDNDTRTVDKKPAAFKDMVKSIMINPHLIALLLHDILRLTAYYLIVATTAYYAKVVMEDPGITTRMLIIFHAGAVIGSYFSSIISKKIGVKKTTALGCASCAVFVMLCYFLPAKESLIAALLFLAQLGFGLAYGLVAGLYTMCGVYSVWKTGEDTRGVIMSLSIFGAKIGIALRSMLIPAMLVRIAYDPSSTVITDAARSGIKMLFLGVPAIVMLISLVPLTMFRLNEKKVADMEKEIAQKNGV